MKKKLSRIEALYVSTKLFERFCDCFFGSIPSIQSHLNYFDVSLHIKKKEDYESLCEKLNSDFSDFEINSFYLERYDEYCICVMIHFDLE